MIVTFHKENFNKYGTNGQKMAANGIITFAA